ncbi:hypothetical protein RA210_U10015 [Rubrivivax sp. A210]|nr:hypothetical protein RA210_U10015 [Rubrivivax sp. A210]
MAPWPRRWGVAAGWRAPGASRTPSLVARAAVVRLRHPVALKQERPRQAEGVTFKPA